MPIGAMTRTLKFILSLVLIAGLYIAWLWFRPIGQFPELQCEHRALTYNGQPLIGAEDMAYDSLNQQIYISAYDRDSKNAGGIYRWNITQKDAEVSRLDLPHTNPNAYWPHGFDLQRDDTRLRLSIIERDLNQSGDLNAHISHYIIAEDETITLSKRLKNKALCSANNLATGANGSRNIDIPQSLYITQDHQSCHKKKQIIADIFNPHGAALLHWQENEPENIMERLAYANGIAQTSKALYLAETRADRLTLLNLSEQTKTEKLGEISLPGGPDNLTSDETTIIAALHPNLIRYAAFRAGWGPRVKSRFSIISAGNDIKTYDLSADLLSGATVALRARNHIYLGAAFDKGIAACELPEGDYE